MVAQTPIAVAALVRDGLVLMVHRHPMRRAYPDCWDLVGGHIDSGEPPHRAVSRECREELGVYIHDPVPIPMTVSDPALDMHAFLVTRWDGEPNEISRASMGGSAAAAAGGSALTEPGPSEAY